MAELVVSLPTSVLPAGQSLVCQPWVSADEEYVGCQDKVDPDVLQLALLAASDLLYMWSGRRYGGVCTSTVRPCAHRVAVDGRWRWYVPPGGTGYGGIYGSAYGGLPWGGGCGCNRADRDGCSSIPEIPLGEEPITVVEVREDGAVLDSTAYRVDDGRWLVRVDGKPWSCCQDMLKADTEPGTWSVKFRHGRQPPPAGRIAAAVLGCQIGLALTPAAAGECRLPKRVSQITRQGVTAVVLDPFSFLDKGRTGLVEVDYFLASVNPKGIIRAATASRPDRARRFRRTG